MRSSGYLTGLSTGSDQMPFKLVKPVIDLNVRRVCTRPYHGHSHGCPNYGKKKSCPPQVPALDHILILDRPIWAVWNAFDFAGHVGRMRNKHPKWSERQLACCLYWQRGARNKLATEVKKFFSETKHWAMQRVLDCPEATGVNVTATMKAIGIELEWPPKKVAYQIALVGTMKQCSETVGQGRLLL